MSSLEEQDEAYGRSRVGEVLDDRWRLVDRLGGGGMGEVYRAVHVALGRTVAIKLLRPEHAFNASSARRVLREGQAASRVTHPNIVRIEDIGVDAQGMPYLVQEFLDGVDLDAFADSRRGVVPARDLLPLMIPALDALAALHEGGILHRDLKPGNIFLVRDGDGWSPRLLDFGLAAIDEARSGSPRITGSTVTLGSPAYMSPEQFRDPRSVTPRSDLWSCGVMIYELLSGVLPFSGATVGAVAVAVSTEAPVPLAQRVSALPEVLASAVMRCLEKDPSRRPASVRELVAACEEALRLLPETADAAPAPVLVTPLDRSSISLRSTDSDPLRSRVVPKKRRWPAVAVGFVAVTGAIAVAVAMTRPSPRTVAPSVTPVTRLRPTEVPPPPVVVTPEPAIVAPPAPVAPLVPRGSPRVASPRNTAQAAVVDAGPHVAPTPVVAVPAVVAVPPVVVAPPPAPVVPPPSPLGVGIDPNYR